jgi:hypothetical protein
MANEYLVHNKRLATGAHRLLVLNPDPADNVGLASWHGVRLRVRLWNTTRCTRNQRGDLEQDERVYDEFPVMFDARSRPRDFLWDLVTTRLPFAEWKSVDCKFRRFLDAPERAGREERMCPRQRREHGAIYVTDESEEAAREALQDLQNYATADAEDDLAANGSADYAKLEVLNKHTLHWCLDIRAKAPVVAPVERSPWPWPRRRAAQLSV